MARRLTLALDFGTSKRILGQMLWDTSRRVAAVEWDRDFARDPLPFSPYSIRDFTTLHLGAPAPFDGLSGVFADSLPDGWGRLLIDRELARRGKPLHLLTPVDRLAIVGKSGMGALTYQPEEEIAPPEEIDLDWFARTVTYLDGDIPVADLQRLRAGTGGSAGVRPKFVALLDPERGILRDHRSPPDAGFAPYIIKYHGPADPVTAAEEEQAYATMARAAGVNMHPTLVLRSDNGESYFAALRFDRDGPLRHHMHTAAGLLNADFRTPTVSYDALLKLTQFVTRHHDDLTEMFRRMVFNVLAHNRDDHTKNHAFLMGSLGNWRLSPAYDISFSNGPGGEHHLDINGNGRTPGKADIVAVGISAGLKPAAITEIIDQVTDAVSDWHTHANAAGVPSGRRKSIGEQIATVSGLVIR